MIVSFLFQDCKDCFAHGLLFQGSKGDALILKELRNILNFAQAKGQDRRARLLRSPELAEAGVMLLLLMIQAVEGDEYMAPVGVWGDMGPHFLQALSSEGGVVAEARGLCQADGDPLQ